MESEVLSSGEIRCGRVRVRPLNAMLGAEIDCGPVQDLSADEARFVRQAWLDNLVVLIGGQSLSDDDLIAFTAHFGELKPPLPASQRANGVVLKADPKVSVISNVVENGVAIGSLGDGEAEWHSDYNFNERPYAAAMLHAIELPAAGGDTGWANMYAAYESLPDALARRIEGLSIKHDETYNAAGILRSGYAPITDLRTSPGPIHPIVRTHPETGHDFLYLGRRRNAYVTGLELDESEQLLDALWAHALKPEFQWRHHWQVGDLVVWDNRCTIHHRNAFPASSRRILHKTQTVGERPGRADIGRRTEPHPRSLQAA